MTYWTLSSSFMGFTEVQATNQTVTLSSSSDTVVDIEIDGPSTSNASNSYLAPNALAISGGFRVCDYSTGLVTSVGALVAQSTTDPADPSKWFIRLIFPPDATTPTLIVKAWGVFAVYSGGTN